MKKLILIGFILFLGCFLSGTASAGLNDGLIAYYPFNGNANDESGNGNNGTVYGPILTQDRFGNPNSAYRFDGVDDFIQVPDSPSFTFVSDFSISLWFINYGNAHRGRLLTKWSDVYRDFHLMWETWTGEACPPNTLIGNISPVDSVCSNVLSLNTWYNVTLVARGGNSLQIYINGELKDSINTLSFPQDSSQPLLIGAYPGPVGPAQVFDGVIDDIRIYNRALSDTDIQQLAHPNQNLLNLNTLKIIKNKRSGNATTSMSGTINLPELNLVNGQTVNSRVTIELFNALPDGDDLVATGEAVLNVTDTSKTLTISK